MLQRWHGNLSDPNVFRPKFLADCRSMAAYLPKSNPRPTAAGTRESEDAVLAPSKTAFVVTANVLVFSG